MLFENVFHDEDDVLDELGVGLVHYHLEQIYNSSVKTGKQVVVQTLQKRNSLNRHFKIVVVLIL